MSPEHDPKTRPTKILYLAEARARDFIKTQSSERTARRPRLSSTIGRSMLPNSQQWPPRPYINGPCPYIFAGCHYIVLQRGERVCSRRACARRCGHAHSPGSALSARKQNGSHVYSGTGGRCDSISWMTNRARNVVRRRLKGRGPRPI